MKLDFPEEETEVVRSGQCSPAREYGNLLNCHCRNSRMTYVIFGALSVKATTWQPLFNDYLELQADRYDHSMSKGERSLKEDIVEMMSIINPQLSHIMLVSSPSECPDVIV